MPPVGFEQAIKTGERTQNSILERAATGVGFEGLKYKNINIYTYYIP